ncbi:hypothetical protein ACT453_31370, partial [Bacillus sp. D-CC]
MKGLDALQDVIVFHAGTAMKHGDFVTLTHFHLIQR